MARKKTNYEKKGIVRQLAGSIFAAPKQQTECNDEKWRPRKNQFERLDGDDGSEFDVADSINRVFSVESETHDYRSVPLFEKKKTVLKHQSAKKRDLSTVTIREGVCGRWW